MYYSCPIRRGTCAITNTMNGSTRMACVLDRSADIECGNTNIHAIEKW